MPAPPANIPGMHRASSSSTLFRRSRRPAGPRGRRRGHRPDSPRILRPRRRSDRSCSKFRCGSIHRASAGTLRAGRSCASGSRLSVGRTPDRLPAYNLPDTRTARGTAGPAPTIWTRCSEDCPARCRRTRWRTARRWRRPPNRHCAGQCGTPPSPDSSRNFRQRGSAEEAYPGSSSHRCRESRSLAHPRLLLRGTGCRAGWAEDAEYERAQARWNRRLMNWPGKQASRLQRVHRRTPGTTLVSP